MFRGECVHPNGSVFYWCHHFIEAMNDALRLIYHRTSAYPRHDAAASVFLFGMLESPNARALFDSLHWTMRSDIAAYAVFIMEVCVFGARLLDDPCGTEQEHVDLVLRAMRRYRRETEDPPFWRANPVLPPSEPAPWLWTRDALRRVLFAHERAAASSMFERIWQHSTRLATTSRYWKNTPFLAVFFFSTPWGARRLRHWLYAQPETRFYRISTPGKDLIGRLQIAHLQELANRRTSK